MRIYLHGNCQTTPLREMLADAEPTWFTSNREVHLIQPEDISALVDDYRSADVVISQPVSTSYGAPELSLEYLRSVMRPDARLVVFPSIYFGGLHLGQIHVHGLPGYTNTHAVMAFLNGKTAEDYVEETGKVDFVKPDFVRSEIEFHLRRLRERETLGADILASDLVAETLSGPTSMHTINHPAQRLLAGVAARLLRKLGSTAAVTPGPEVLNSIHFPPYRSVSEVTGSLDEPDQIFINGQNQPRVTLFTEVFRQYAELGRSYVEQKVADCAELQAYLKRHAEQHA